MALQPFVGHWPLFQSLHLFTQSVGLLEPGRWGGGRQAVARPLPAHRTAQTQNKRIQTSMPQVERAKTVHALGRAATVMGKVELSL
jgi:hypothetical protein